MWVSSINVACTLPIKTSQSEDISLGIDHKSSSLRHCNHSADLCLPLDFSYLSLALLIQGAHYLMLDYSTAKLCSYVVSYTKCNQRGINILCAFILAMNPSN